eukprot:Nk52_evm2s258 gene=Nk52_evmTU2s258
MARKIINLRTGQEQLTTTTSEKNEQENEDDSNQEKVFINLVHHPQVPTPESLSRLSDLQILDIINKTLNHQDGDQPFVEFRVPLSLSPPRAELDRNGNACTVYDALISSAVWDRATKISKEKSLAVVQNASKSTAAHAAPSGALNHLFFDFLIELAMEWIEAKYEQEEKSRYEQERAAHPSYDRNMSLNVVLLSRDYKVLKNRKYFGGGSGPVPQYIRRKSKPQIATCGGGVGELTGKVSQQTDDNNNNRMMVMKKKKKNLTPRYNIKMLTAEEEASKEGGGDDASVSGQVITGVEVTVQLHSPVMMEGDKGGEEEEEGGDKCYYRSGDILLDISTQGVLLLRTRDQYNFLNVTLPVVKERRDRDDDEADNEEEGGEGGGLIDPNCCSATLDVKNNGLLTINVPF